jgi:Domain of unknown function (DUF5047)
MYPTTDAFRRQIVDPQSYKTRIYSLLDPGDRPSEITDYFVDGSLVVARQETRTSGVLTFSNDDGTMLPADPDHPLALYGQELLIHRGVTYPDSSEELIPQGPMRITGVGSEDGGQTIKVRVFDRSWRVKRGKSEKPITIAKGTLVTAAIESLLTRAWPGIVLDIVPTTEVTPTIILDAFSDPWVESHKLATSLGYELYFDRDGVCQLHPETDNTDAQPVWVYDDGSALRFLAQTAEAWANQGLSTVGIDFDSEDAHNVWIVRGENTENAAPFVGIYRHTDANSPLRYGGRFGPSVSGTIDPNVTSSGMALKAATAKAARELGVTEAVTVPAMLNSALGINDPILIVRERLGINQIHVVDQYTMPLRAAQQAIATRRRQVVHIDG